MTSDQHQCPISDHRMTSALRWHDQRSTTICDQISALGFGTGFHVLGFGFHNHYLLVYGSHYLLIAGCIMMISIGFNAAVSVGVSNELGAGHDKSAAFSVAVVNLVSFILYLIAAIVVLALRNVISYAFTDGETVARAVSELCPLLAFSLILNGIQPVLSGNMVGVDSRHTGANHYFGMGDLSDRLEGATPFFS